MVGEKGSGDEGAERERINSRAEEAAAPESGRKAARWGSDSLSSGDLSPRKSMVCM